MKIENEQQASGTDNDSGVISTEEPVNTNGMKHGFNVGASPFNGVKLELVILLIAAILFWAVLETMTDNLVKQLTGLLLFSVSASLWLVMRIRHLKNRISC